MARLTIYRDNHPDSTVVPNLFIDEYMKDANDAQLKVYFYLLRMMGARQAASVPDIADRFNHTEREVLRALKYWQSRNLLELEYDADKALVGIHIRDLSSCAASPAPKAPESPETDEKKPYQKPSYSPERLREFQSRAETAQLLFIAESYIGRPLSANEIRTILYFTDILQFSDDLIDYLIQYCVDLGKKDFKYIEKVAVSWAEQGFRTPAQAQENTCRYDKDVYTIMNGLGKSGSPTKKEAEYISRWRKEYAFSTEIILTACERTVLATDRHRFEYAEKILSSWKCQNVQQQSDISRIDDAHRQQHRRTSTPSKPANHFNQFTQNSYDFDILERELVSN